MNCYSKIHSPEENDVMLPNHTRMHPADEGFRGHTVFLETPHKIKKKKILCCALFDVQGPGEDVRNINAEELQAVDNFDRGVIYINK